MRRGIVLADFFNQLPVNVMRAAFDVQAAGQSAVFGQPAFQAAVHHRPDAVEAVVQLAGCGAAGQLIGALHLGDGLTAFSRHGHHLFGVAEGVRHDGLRSLIVFAHVIHFVRRHHKAAADAVVDLAADFRVVLIQRDQLHAIGVAAQDLVVVEQQVGLRVEPHGGQAVDRDGLVACDGLQRSLSCGVIVGVGQVTGEAEDNRAVAGVALAGESQRAVQAGAQVRWLQSFAAQTIEEPASSDHGAHRV